MSKIEARAEAKTPINVPIFLLAVFLSMALWFIRVGQDLLEPGTVSIKLPNTNVVGLPAKLQVMDISGIKLQLQGPAEQVGRAESDQNLTDLITVDLSSARPGRGDYPLEYSGLLRQIVQSPKFVRVTLEEIITKSVPIVVDLKGKLSDPNTNLESYPTNENSATVTAVKSTVDRITAARSVLDLNQINPNNPLPQQSLLVAIDDRRQTYEATIEPQRVTITPIVIAAHIQKSALVNPVIMGTPAAGYLPVGAKLDPKEVQVSGPTSTLVNMGTVKTEAIDITGLTAPKSFTVKLVLPAGTSSPTKYVHIRYDVELDPAVKRAKATPPAVTPPSTTATPGAQP